MHDTCLCQAMHDARLCQATWFCSRKAALLKVHAYILYATITCILYTTITCILSHNHLRSLHQNHVCITTNHSRCSAWNPG